MGDESAANREEWRMRQQVRGMLSLSKSREIIRPIHAISRLPHTTSRNASTAKVIDMNSANISSVDLAQPHIVRENV